MGRTGMRVEDAESFLEDLLTLPGLRLASLYTHFPDADAGTSGFAHDQVRHSARWSNGSTRAVFIRRGSTRRTAPGSSISPTLISTGCASA
jgi:alanine racemase